MGYFIRPMLALRRGQAQPTSDSQDFQTALPSRWQTALRIAARLMPSEEGKRWLGEADSLLFELPAGLWPEVTGNYLLTAPHVAVIAWTQKLSRQAR